MVAIAIPGPRAWGIWSAIALPLTLPRTCHGRCQRQGRWCCVSSTCVHVGTGGSGHRQRCVFKGCHGGRRALPQQVAAERASAVAGGPAVDTWLVELVLAGQLAKHVTALKVTQADLSRVQNA